MIIDTADKTTDKLQQLKAAGVTAIIRYYSASDWKRVSPEEARAIAGAGLEMGAVYEDAGATATTFNGATGVEHANRALNQAALCGQPFGSAIYFAVDFDPTGTQIKNEILPYFDGVYQTIGGKYRVGAYASGDCCTALLERYTHLLPWITCSLGFSGTRFFLAHGRQALYQGTFDGYGNPKSGCDKILYGLSVDYNTAHVDNWGQFTPFGANWINEQHERHNVEWMQYILKVKVDGIVGTKTIAAMIKYLEDH